MKILFVDPILRTAETNEIPPAATIKESLPYNYCRALHEQGHQVTLISCDDFRPTAAEDHPFPVVFLPSRLGKLFPPRAIPFIPGLAGWLRGRHGAFDMVVCGEAVGLHTLMAAWLCPSRTVVWHELALHHRMLGGLASRAWFPLFAGLLSRVRAIVPRSANARRFLSSWFRELSPLDVEHGVDGALFDPLESKEDRFVVVARLVPPKRIDQILRSFADHVRLAGAATELWIVGDGPSMEDLRSLAVELGIADRTRFLGRLPHERIAGIVAGSKAFLYKAYYDNSLLAAAESIASGTPVLITRSIDNADMVERLGLGIARDEWDHRELAAMDARAAEFVRNCREHRREVTVQWQASRLVEAFERGNEPVPKNVTGGERRRRPRILVVSQNCFAPCEAGVLAGLRREFDVRWGVFFPRDERTGWTEDEFRAMGRQWGIPTRVVRLAGRLRSIGVAREFRELFRWLRDAGRHELVYVNSTGFPWLAPLVLLRFGRRRVVWCLHDVVDHRVKSRWSPDALYKRAIARWFGGFHFLSSNQKELFLRLNPGRRAYLAPHPPREFGPGTATPPTDRIRFFFFGFIARYKGVDILIEAAQRLWESGVRGFEVAIAGKCDDWSEFSGTIRIPGIFKLDIRSLDNSEIPDLYTGSHYLVLPYRDVTQSGPLASAIAYHVPAIVSDHPGFREFGEPERTILPFPNEDVDALAERMRQAVEGGTAMWESMRREVADLENRRFSSQACTEAYARMFRDHLGTDFAASYVP